MNTAFKKYAIGLAFTLGVLWSTSASAATFSSCSGAGYDVSGYVSGAVDCTVSDDFSNDAPPPTVVNTPTGFFDFTDWLFGGKIGVNAGYTGTGTTVDGEGAIGGQIGTYAITALGAATWQDIMLVFKDGGGTTLVGYLLDNGVLAGTWQSPFVSALFPEANGNDTKDASHISVYYRECTANCAPVEPIPIPGGILLLISALGGLGFLARARKAGATA
jgi:hypothetical protein